MAITDLVSRYRDPLPQSTPRTVTVPSSTPTPLSPPSLTISSILSISWDTFKLNAKYLVLATLILGLSVFIPRVIANTLLKNTPLASSIASFIAWMIASLASLSFINALFLLIKNQHPSLTSFYRLPLPLYLKYLITSILFNILTALGLILLIVPGILVLVRLQFYPFYLLEENLSPVSALKHSWSLTKGHFWNILLFQLLNLFLNLLGTLLLGLGLFVSVPLTTLITSRLYLTLKR